mgnify:CR=1 FL=1
MIRFLLLASFLVVLFLVLLPRYNEPLLFGKFITAKDILFSKPYKPIINFEDFKLNDIGRIKIRSSKPLFYDSYKKNRHTGSIILIDPNTNATIAAGMII